MLIVDRFEELYTLASEAQRQACLHLILAANNAPAFTLVITLRADFYGAALAYRPLSDLLQNAVFNLSAMSREELERAIALPAQKREIRYKLIDSVDR